jgi:hypothetical protein
MHVPKTETLTVRLAPEVKAALRQAADQERRSLANMLEVMIRDWCGRELASPRADFGSGAHQR